MSKIALILLHIYSKASRLFPENCRYYPTCSKYAKESFRIFSFFKALKLTISRIFRCNPFSKGGFDPVKH